MTPIDAVVRLEVIRHLRMVGGNQRQAAQSVCISRWTLARYMKSLNIEREDYATTERRQAVSSVDEGRKQVVSVLRSTGYVEDDASYEAPWASILDRRRREDPRDGASSSGGPGEDHGLAAG